MHRLIWRPVVNLLYQMVNPSEKVAGICLTMLLGVDGFTVPTVKAIFSRWQVDFVHPVELE